MGDAGTVPTDANAISTSSDTFGRSSSPPRAPSKEPNAQDGTQVVQLEASQPQGKPEFNASSTEAESNEGLPTVEDLKAKAGDVDDGRPNKRRKFAADSQNKFDPSFLAESNDPDEIRKQV